MFDTTGKIAIAQLVFFLLAIPVAFYCIFMHGKHGLFGWLFIAIFCIIRIVGAALIVNDESGNKPVSEAGLIISSVAVAPLIIGIAAIAHESYLSIIRHGRFIFGPIVHLVVHVACVIAIVLIALGFTKAFDATSTASDVSTGINMSRAGSIILLVIWIGIAVILVLSYRHPRMLRGEKQLAAGVSIALLALFVRILYTVLGAFIDTTSWNVRTGGSLAEKVVLDILPEFILTVALLGAGVMSRRLDDERKASNENAQLGHQLEQGRVFHK